MPNYRYFIKCWRWCKMFVNLTCLVNNVHYASTESHNNQNHPKYSSLTAASLFMCKTSVKPYLVSNMDNSTK